MIGKKDVQIHKFGWYGLLKNLRFFEPFLWIYLLASGLSFLEIGFLYSIREIIVYVFEIPSGVIADRFGKKNELIVCFLFYIISFIFFFIGERYYIFVIAMVLFGFGEAFRSGTHKAMIMSYLDKNELKESKSQVYGFTRSISNIGSAISSVLGVLLYLYTLNISVLFLLAIIPYVLDLLLIISYPSYLNNRIDSTFTVKGFLKENVYSIKYALTTKGLNRCLFESASFTAIFKTIKDYIQPLIIGVGISYLILEGYNEEDHLMIIVGMIYAISQFISVFISKNAYRLENVFPIRMILNITWLLMAIVSIFLGLFTNYLWVIVVSYILYYGLQNIRKPFMVEKIGDASEESKRASVLSIESQITSLIVMFLAPLLGYISDTLGIGYMFISLGVLMLFILLFQGKEKSA